MTLMAMLFALVFVTELISWIGQSVLLEFVRHHPPSAYIRRHQRSDDDGDCFRTRTHMQVYALYLRIFYSGTVAKQRKLKSEILLNKKELLQTSAQDQFAKWAKLRRSVDKGLADLEKLSEYCVIVMHLSRVAQKWPA